MRALRVHATDSLDGLRLDDDLPVPEPRPGEVRVRVEATAVAFVDLLMARHGYQVKPALPFVAGSEFAGVIDACGDGVPPHLAPGVRVGGSIFVGGWAERICVPAHNLQPAGPDADPAAVSALSAAFGTAHYACVGRGRVQPGETVFVLGAAGSVGHAAVQVAKQLGAQVIAGAGSAAKRDAALAAGADAAIDTSADDWRERLRAAVPGGAVDVVVDPVGGTWTEPAFRSLRWNGRLLVIGYTGGTIPSIRTNLALLKGASLVGVDVKQFGEHEPAAAEANLARVFELHAAGKLKPLIAETAPLADWRRALGRVEDRATVGRIVIDWR